VSCIECTSSCIKCVGWKLGSLEVLVVGGIYSPNHQSGCWGRLLSKGAPDTVRCASHVTQPLGFDRWSSDKWGHRTVRWCTRHVLFTVRCAIWRLLSLCARSRHYSLFTFAVDRWRCSRYSAWHTGQSGATPNSPVNYSGGQFQKPEGGKFGVDLPDAPDTVRWCTGHCPVAQRTVGCARPGLPLVVFCSFYLNPFLDFLLVCVEPLAPVELII
jgi:hypothetical protein